MSQVAQVRKALRPTMKRHADLLMRGRAIFLKPAHHFVRMISISGTSSPNHFEARWVVMHLFEVSTFVFFNWGESLWDRRWPPPTIWWRIDDGVEASLIDAIETQALPRLRAMTTFDDFLAHVAGNTFGPHLYDWPTSRIILDVALGELDHARMICEKEIDYWLRGEPYHDDDTRAKYARLAELCRRLMADDRAGLIELLHAWEAQTVQALKIEAIWEPTPFPIERM